ncbi:hypothetical protein HYV70_04235 [Candidatus Uhrbacteria bacterium]|nr:hypothetical protein [Candidatus Uhrbacteria bacterium]
MTPLILGLTISHPSSVVAMAGGGLWEFLLVIGLLLLVIVCMRRME